MTNCAHVQPDLIWNYEFFSKAELESLDQIAKLKNSLVNIYGWLSTRIHTQNV